MFIFAALAFSLNLERLRTLTQIAELEHLLTIQPRCENKLLEPVYAPGKD